VIVLMHVASGAAAGAAVGSRTRALLLGPLLHLVGDVIPHRDIPSRAFETGSGIVAGLALVAVRGPFDPATLGALSASAPDLEHVIDLPRPGGRKLFPTHRFPGWHKAGGVPAWAQLAVAGALLGAVLRQAPRRTG
jgi:hypothetical protein